jgi:hypothetical protein
MQFFHYRQNNSGGDFVGPINVFVQADTTEQSDAIAIQNGIYFDGCREGRDCPCCGDRWSRAWGSDSADESDIAYAIRTYGRGEVRIIVRGE